MGDYDLDTNMNTMNVQFCNGKDHQDFQDREDLKFIRNDEYFGIVFVYVIGWDWLVTFS